MFNLEKKGSGPVITWIIAFFIIVSLLVVIYLPLTFMIAMKQGRLGGGVEESVSVAEEYLVTESLMAFLSSSVEVNGEEIEIPSLIVNARRETDKYKREYEDKLKEELHRFAEIFNADDYEILVVVTEDNSEWQLSVSGSEGYKSESRFDRIRRNVPIRLKKQIVFPYENKEIIIYTYFKKW